MLARFVPFMPPSSPRSRSPRRWWARSRSADREQFRFDEIVRTHLEAHGDPRTVIADPHARYFNTELQERSLVPDDGARLLPTTYDEWVRRSAAPESSP